MHVQGIAGICTSRLAGSWDVIYCICTMASRIYRNRAHFPHRCRERLGMHCDDLVKRPALKSELNDWRTGMN